MLSAQMEEAFRRFRGQQGRTGGPPPLSVLRAHFAPGGKRFPIPGDVEVRRAVDGVWTAEWLCAPGVDPSRVVLMLHGGGFMICVAGDSAGGNLTLLLLSHLRQHEETLPSAAAVMSPFTDHSCSGASFRERVGRDPIFVPERLEHISAEYLHGADPRSPAVSALFAPLAGLPPLLVQVGTEELLYSDSERLVQRAREHGVDVTFEIGEGLLHVYQSVGDAPEAIAATDRIGAFFKQAWGTVR